MKKQENLIDWTKYCRKGGSNFDVQLGISWRPHRLVTYQYLS